ncbi:MAG: TIGR02996 domain-containing protein [Alphaproteobacteria bacterium]|nr:TIGR02996 domain-containing protein [Alphaproteobacteria bacterium]MCB9693989.1 TIGR02996 domain-containing protein [Alphaproteobacteria bacterium]
MSTRLPPDLLAAVVAAPDDDGPRLVLADALLERGDPRGELIRLQCLPRLDVDQRVRATMLVRTHWREWAAGLQDVLADPPVFARGFAHRVVLGPVGRPGIRVEPDAALVREVWGSWRRAEPTVLAQLVGLRSAWVHLEAEVRVLPPTLEVLRVDRQVPLELLMGRFPRLRELSMPFGGDVALATRALETFGLERLAVGEADDLARWLPLRARVPHLAAVTGGWRAEWNSADGLELELHPEGHARPRDRSTGLVEAVRALPQGTHRWIWVRGGQVAEPERTGNAVRYVAKGTPVRLPAAWKVSSV